VGENRTFDHVFATYKPTKGQSVDNLLSRKIITADGTPGPNFFQAAQFQADDFHQDKYQISPEKDAQDVVYPTLPPSLTGGPSDVCKDIWTLAQAMALKKRLIPHVLPISAHRRHRTAIARSRPACSERA